MRRRSAWVFLLSLLVCCDGNEQGHVSANVRGDMSHVEIERDRYDAAQQAACGPGGPTEESGESMPRWPYVQKVTSDSAEVLFTSTVERPFRIVARTADGQLIDDVPAVADPAVRPSRGTQYVATLGDLKASEIVCYELLAGDQSWTFPTGFRTAPAPDADETIRFIAFGDLGKRTPDQYAVLEQIQEVPMDLAVITGDVAYDDGRASELEANFFGVYREMLGQVPFFPASGNHDYKTDDGRPFRDAFSLFTNGGPEGEERWYSFDWGPVHFVMLDTERMSPAQQQWLDEDLGAHDRPWVVAVGHRPPYSGGKKGSDRDVRDAFSSILAAHDVPLALFGHEHSYERTHPQDGVVYVVTGGGGRGTRPVGEADFTAVIDRVAHFMWVEADSEQMRIVAIDATGEAFDSAVFERR